MVLSVWVLSGWYSGHPQVLAVPAGINPMSFVTGAVLVLVGLGFVALGFRRYTLARLAAAAGGIVGLIRLFQAATGTPQSFEMVTERLRWMLPPAPAAVMAPNTALGIAMIAAGLWMLSTARQSRGRAIRITLCGAAGAALGFSALVGYLTGLPTYGRGRFNSMALDTAAALAVLGTGVLVIHSRASRGPGCDRRAVTAMIVLAAGLVTAVSLWQSLAAVEQLHVESAVRLRSQLPEIVLGFVVLLSGLLCATTYLAQTARLQAARAERLRQEAEREAAERTLALEALAAVERQSRTLLENLPQKIAYKDRNSVYLSCNENFARDLNMPAAAIAGHTDYEYFPKELAEKYRADDAQVMESGETRDFDETYLWHGAERLVHTVKTPVRNESGGVQGVIVIFWDVTESKNAENAIRRAAAYNRRLIEASLDPLVTISPEGKITDVNRTTVEVTGQARERLIGTDFSDYFTDPERARLGYQKVFREGSVQDYELAIRRSDGHVTPVLYNASVYRDEGG